LGPRNVRRWEIKILPGEDLKDFERKEKVMEVLSNYVDVTALKIWRTATYKHRVTSSKKWKINNIFIAGDSAHRTPPFLGQGLCTGIRDVANLSWKILHTEKFGLNDKILNTYEKERKPHAKVVIKHAKEFGKIIGELNLERAKKRDAILRPQLISGKMETTRQKFIPDIKGNLLIQKSLKTKECRNGGTLFVQPRLRFPRGQEKLMDDVIPMSFLYISTGLNQQIWMDPYETFWRKLGGIRIIIMKDAERKETTPKDIVITKEVGKIFSDWSSKMSCEAVLVRPDRYVFSTIHNQEDINAAIKKLRTILSQKH
jgi:3-(3-hydroxy-phenyl)propionate hydroxylase